ALGDYGGPTLTMPLPPGSPAIGGGTSDGAPATDQRGQPRSGRVDIGAFQSQAPLLVNDTTDGIGSAAGRLSLRQALNLANELVTAETISFDPAVFGTTPQTITLTVGPLKLTDTATTTIQGPGASKLTLSGGGASRVIELDGGSAAISDLTVGGGNADVGAGIYNNGGTATLTDCALTGNNAKSSGGGLATLGGGTTTLTNSTVSGNNAPGG